MGRETKFLLAFLAALAGAFVGALSMKLLVPRPPAGAGPDVDSGAPIAVRQELVDPPALALATEPLATEPRRDAPVARTAFEEAAPPAPPASDPPTRPEPPADPPIAAARPPLQGMHVVEPGDSWWSLAERAYGDGRLYRPLFAWNRSLDPSVSLVPGSRLEIPPLVRLAAAWPRLMPRD